MKTFTNTFDVSFKPNGFTSKRARLIVILENVSTAQEAKELLWNEQRIFATSISRLS